MKKRRLIITQEYDLEVYGINTSLKGYRLCWQLGESLGIPFQKAENISLPSAPKTPFACYKSINEECETCFVIENEFNGQFYQPKYKIADFFLIKFVDSYLLPVDNLKNRLQEITQIQAVFPIDTSNAKKAEPFMLDF